MIDYEHNSGRYMVDITQYRSNEKLVNDMLTLGQQFQASKVKASENLKDDSVVINRPYVQIDDLADLNDSINSLTKKVKEQQTS